MEQKSLDNLEFSKILALVAGFAGSNAAKDAILALRPSTDPAMIETTLNELDEFCSILDNGGHVPVAGLREMRDIFDLLGQGDEVLAGDELLRVRANLEISRKCRKALAEAKAIPLLTARLEAMPDLGVIEGAITQSISEQGEVRDDASPRLFGLRRELVRSRQELEKKLGELLSTRAEFFQDHFFTIRNDRYVVPVKASFQNSLQGIVHDQSGSGQTVFVEPLEFLGLNNRLARLKAEEREEVLRILRSLTELLSANGADLRSTFTTLIVLETLLAKSRFAGKYQAYRPEVIRRGRLNLQNARHPLIHPDCVPLDVEMDEKARSIVITGPNGGGKTVALKTIGVNILLMQTGCYVLANRHSQVPVFDQVLADIGESQSIEDHLSTFTAHIKRLNEMLALATPDSLVLIDEVGGGTDPIEGAALAVGVLRALVRRGTLSIVTSHYDALKQAAFTTPGFMNAGMEFDYQSFRPTFRFVQGIPGKSNALAISRMHGVPEEVLTEMSALLEGKGGNETMLLESLERERSRAESLRRTWEEKNRQISLQQNELEVGLKKLEEFRRARRDELVESYEEKLKTRLKDIESLIHQIKTRLQTGTGDANDLELSRLMQKDTVKAIDELHQKTRFSPSSPQESSPKSLAEGDIVTWGGSPRHCTIESISTDHKRAIIEFEGKSLNVALSELVLVADHSRRPGKPASSVATGGAPLVKGEIDLRGMRVEEALQEAESYLKLAESNKLGRAFLIHGKGTGALQKAVHEFLKRSPWKKKFRFGRYGEGDMGVTIVVFDPAADVDERYKTTTPADTAHGRRKR
jgi:DNA mismatch repair protein MutS2